MISRPTSGIPRQESPLCRGAPVARPPCERPPTWNRAARSPWFLAAKSWRPKQHGQPFQLLSADRPDCCALRSHRRCSKQADRWQVGRRELKPLGPALNIPECRTLARHSRRFVAATIGTRVRQIFHRFPSTDSQMAPWEYLTRILRPLRNRSLRLVCVPLNAVGSCTPWTLPNLLRCAP